MSRQKVDSAAMESSSSEDAEEDDEEQEDDDNDAEEHGEGESGSESSSEDDEFDSADDRVNIVPNETETVKSLAQAELSDESESEEEEEEEEEGPLNPAMKPAEAKKMEAIKSFDSDVESEYETESGSESEGLTQKTMVKESPIDAEEALPLTQKKAKKDDIVVNQGIAEDDHFVTKHKDKALKQQQEPKPAKIVEGAMKGQGAVKQILEDNEHSQSVMDEKKGDLSAKKRKIGSTQKDRETDSGDSVPISKRRRAVDAAQNGKAGADSDKLAHTPSDTAKEAAKKIFTDSSAKSSGSKKVVNNKVATVDHEPPKQMNADARKGLASPQKQKKLPHVWSTDEEITMASEVLNRVKMGLEVPSKRNDDFWVTLSEILHEKLGIEFSRDQLSEKLRRMKQRYQSMVPKTQEEPHKSPKSSKYKTSNNEQNLLDIWSQIWGRAELTFSEDHQAASDFKKEPSKPSVVSVNSLKEGINTSKLSKSRSASKAKASKESAVENSLGRDASQPETIMTMPMDLDKGEAKKEDHATDDLMSFANASAVLSKDMHKLLQDKIHITLNELQEWSKNTLETWMSKALALIENSTKALGDQARFMNATGIAGGAFPMRLFDSMEFQLVHGEQAFQQQWYELRLQELNIYSQRLELMQKECKLKQEQLKLQLQLERGK